MSRSIAGLFRNQEITDLTLVCKDGHLVETHISLMAVLSKELGELFTSLPTLPSLVIVPDVEKEALEEVLMLYTKEWKERKLTFEQIKAADLLGFPLISKSDKKLTSQGREGPSKIWRNLKPILRRRCPQCWCG